MASLFNFASKSSTPRPKTHVSHGTLPAHIDARQPPTKRSPWRQMRSIPFARSVSITLPTPCYDALLPDLNPTSAPSTPSPSTISPPRYFKLLAPLSDILAPTFLDPFVKTGDVVLLAQGAPGVSASCVRVCGGRITIEMGKEVYERAGLQGRVVQRNAGARKHGRDRFVVEMDLRAPEMSSGRKGFERLLAAARGVLGEGRVWLGRDVTVDTGGSGSGLEQRDAVLRAMHAVIVEGQPDVDSLPRVVVPAGLARWRGATVEAERLSKFEDDYHELVEWLDLVKMGSPRVTQGDSPDSYISRYAVPDRENGDMADLRIVTWSGLLDHEWCTRLLIELVRRSRRAKCREWLAVTINSHRTEALGQVDGCTIVFHANDHEDAEQNDTDTVMQEDRTPEQDGMSHFGFQRFTCFQFVDSVTA